MDIFELKGKNILSSDILTHWNYFVHQLCFVPLSAGRPEVWPRFKWIREQMSQCPGIIQVIQIMNQDNIRVNKQPV